ncbi:MAG: hypothetical protein QOD82_7435 [Pseudonocardiales bacterium]|nr:hypothetical protein [Pseudonocardiales bacterium]
MIRVSAPVAPPSRSTASLPIDRRQIDHLQVHLQVHSITASMCISKFTRIPPPSSRDHSLQCISKLARSPLLSASPNSFDRHLQVHFQSRSITASKIISKLARPPPPRCISKFTRSRTPIASPSSLNRCLQVLLHLSSSTVGSQIVCTYIYR